MKEKKTSKEKDIKIMEGKGEEEENSEERKEEGQTCHPSEKKQQREAGMPENNVKKL